MTDFSISSFLTKLSSELPLDLRPSLPDDILGFEHLLEQHFLPFENSEELLLNLDDVFELDDSVEINLLNSQLPDNEIDPDDPHNVLLTESFLNLFGPYDYQMPPEDFKVLVEESIETDDFDNTDEEQTFVLNQMQQFYQFLDVRNAEIKDAFNQVEQTLADLSNSFLTDINQSLAKSKSLVVNSSGLVDQPFIPDQQPDLEINLEMPAQSESLKVLPNNEINHIAPSTSSPMDGVDDPDLLSADSEKPKDSLTKLQKLGGLKLTKNTPDMHKNQSPPLDGLVNRGEGDGLEIQGLSVNKDQVESNSFPELGKMKLPANSNLPSDGQNSPPSSLNSFSASDQGSGERSFDGEQSSTDQPTDQQSFLGTVESVSSPTHTSNTAPSFSEASNSQLAQLSESQITAIINRVQRELSQLSRANPSLTIQINPENLGQIDIQVRVQENGLHIFLMANAASTEHILDSSLSELKTALKNTGINLANLNVGSLGHQGRASTSSRQGRSPQQPVLPNPGSVSSESPIDDDAVVRRLSGDYIIDYLI